MIGLYQILCNAGILYVAAAGGNLHLLTTPALKMIGKDPSADHEPGEGSERCSRISVEPMSGIRRTDLLSGEIDVAVHAGQTNPETYYFKYMAGTG
jgi:hypothetical protein